MLACPPGVIFLLRLKMYLDFLQAEKERQKKLNTTARDGLETRKKRDIDTKVFMIQKFTQLLEKTSKLPREKT